MDSIDTSYIFFNILHPGHYRSIFNNSISNTIVLPGGTLFIKLLR